MATEKDIKIIDGKVCITNQALYEMLDINESTLIRWGQKGCPKIAYGWWNISDVLKWRGLMVTNKSESNQIENLITKTIYNAFNELSSKSSHINKKRHISYIPHQRTRRISKFKK